MFEAKFGQAGLLKRIIGAIDGIIPQIEFYCTENAMCLQVMDANDETLVYLKLENRLFEDYRCTSTVRLAFSLDDLTNILMCTKDKDTCTISYSDKGSGCIKFIFEDYRHRKQCFALRLVDATDTYLAIPEQMYACIVDMPSAEFQRTCHDIALLSDTISITANRANVIFSGADDNIHIDISYPKTAYSEDGNGIVVIAPKEPMKITFLVNCMSYFTNATLLCDRVRISFSEDIPVVLEYGIDDGGFLRFYLAPMAEDDKAIE